jgi:hypothetical protein
MSLNDRVRRSAAQRYVSMLGTPFEREARMVPISDEHSRFERPKLLMTLPNGERRLHQFFGCAWDRAGTRTGAEHALAHLAKLAERGFAPRPHGSRHGFVVRPWIEGCALRREELHQIGIDHIARYLGASAGPPLAQRGEASFRRTLSMLLHNAREAGIAVRLPGEIDMARHAWMPSARDKLLAPRAWLRTADGILKVDPAGHDVDHTVVGEQPITWDVAGAMIEWRMEPEAARAFVRACERACATELPFEQLAFHRLAYTAFRLGQATLALEDVEGSERDRILLERDRYRTQLEEEAGS